MPSNYNNNSNSNYNYNNNNILNKVKTIIINNNQLIFLKKIKIKMIKMNFMEIEEYNYQKNNLTN